MEENIFIKMRKEKFNPDIEPKLKSKEEERENTRFELNTSIYNPITSGVPNKITSIKDLVLEKDIPFDKVNLHKLISDKNAERLCEDAIYKPVKTKVINNGSVQQTNEIKNTVNTPNVNRTNYIETFEDMKNGTFGINKKPVNQQNYNNILDGLKDLGIFK
jgi:hypothetical protein